MAEKHSVPFSGELASLLERADELSADPALTKLVVEGARDEGLRERALRDGPSFLGEQGINVPDGLEVKFLDDPMRDQPVPDFELFTIRFFNCRTYWVQGEPGKPPKKETVCFGFEIVPNPVPGGPIG
jgi:hypothetical protein